MVKGGGKQATSTTFQVKVVPRAKKDQIAGVMQDGSLKIRLTAAPVDGKANRALIKLLAKSFNISSSEVTILTGEMIRHKRIRIDGITPLEFQNFLESLN